MSVKEEISKLNTAIDKVSTHLKDMSKIASDNYGEDNAEIFRAQYMLLNDAGLYSAICTEIEKGISASEAVLLVTKEIEESFGSQNHEYFQSKATDIADISKRLINVIDGHALMDESEGGILSGVVFGDELTVSDILLLDSDKVSEIIFNNTSEFSHRVIIARSKGIKVSFGTEKKSIVAEIAQVSEIAERKFMRTEFLYMNRDDIPCIDEQIKTYIEYIQDSEPLNDNVPVIRLFDLGGDKNSMLVEKAEGETSLVASRGVRKALSHEELLREQIRAIISAALKTQSKIGILVPMIATEQEVLKVSEIIDDESQRVLEGLDNTRPTGIKNLIEYGIMIETPAAALISDKLAGQCEFFMIGLNDLLQYTYGCDRNSKELEVIFEENKDSILRLIDIVKKNAKLKNISVSICGTNVMQ